MMAGERLMMKIDTGNFLNNTIGSINRTLEWVEEAREAQKEDGERPDLEALEDLIGEEFFSFDIGARILVGHLKRIAERALELGDPALIDMMCDIGALKKEDGEAKPDWTPTPTAEPAP